MKKYVYMGVEIPECNGRPQLWDRGSHLDHTPRIIYPNGTVTYIEKYGTDFCEDPGCTSRITQLAAIKASIEYSARWGEGAKCEFLGYL